MARSPDLEAKLIEDPSDVDAYLVYADFLQTKGDPRGELITLFHRGKVDEAEAFLEEHADELYGPLKNYRTTFDGSDEKAFEWRLGFIRKATLSYDSNSADEVEVEGDEEVALEKGLAALLTHPSGMFLEELVVPMNMLDDGAYFEAIVKTIAEHGAPALRRLRIGEFTHAGPGGGENDYEYEISWTSLGDASGLWKAVPRLRHLVLQVGLGGTSADSTKDILGSIDLPLLQHLEVITGGMAKDCLQSFAEAKLPALERLDLWLGSSSYGFEGGIEHVEKILEGTNLPKLRRLGLMNTEIADEICERLPSAKILPRLEELSLAHGTMSDAGAQALARGAPAFAHLSLIDLSDNNIGDDGIAGLAALGSKVTTGKQKGDDERYVSLSE
jgi:uncharacterized protein (TIGR02996 family)